MTPTVPPLADAALAGLGGLAPARETIGERVAAFVRRFGGPVLDPWTLRIEGRPGSREAARAHAAAAGELTGLLQSHPVTARVELVALPWFRATRGFPADAKVDAAFAEASAASVIRRLDRLAGVEAGGRIASPALHPAGISAFRPMVAALGLSWGRYLEQAFRPAARIDPDAFAESPFDWLLHADDPRLSAALAAEVHARSGL